MEESLSADEWARWIDYEALYDLPDAYLVAGQLGAIVANIMGNKTTPADFAPYYKTEKPAAQKQPDLSAAMAFFKANVQPRKSHHVAKKP